MGEFLQRMGGTNITRIQVYSIPDMILLSQNSALVVVLSHVFFGLCKCRSGLQECGVHPVLEFIDSLKSGFWLVWFKAHPWMLASVEHEGGLLGGRMYMVVVLDVPLQVSTTVQWCISQFSERVLCGNALGILAVSSGYIFQDQLD